MFLGKRAWHESSTAPKVSYLVVLVWLCFAKISFFVASPPAAYYLSLRSMECREERGQEDSSERTA